VAILRQSVDNHSAAKHQKTSVAKAVRRVGRPHASNRVAPRWKKKADMREIVLVANRSVRGIVVRPIRRVMTTAIAATTDALRTCVSRMASRSVMAIVDRRMRRISSRSVIVIKVLPDRRSGGIIPGLTMRDVLTPSVRHRPTASVVVTCAAMAPVQMHVSKAAAGRRISARHVQGMGVQARVVFSRQSITVAATARRCRGVAPRVRSTSKAAKTSKAGGGMISAVHNAAGINSSSNVVQARPAHRIPNHAMARSLALGRSVAARPQAVHRPSTIVTGLAVGLRHSSVIKALVRSSLPARVVMQRRNAGAMERPVSVMREKTCADKLTGGGLEN